MEGFNWFIIYLKYMESKNEIGFHLIYVFDQWPWLRNPSWLEAPSVREYPQQNMAKHMVLTYLHVLDPEDLPVKNGRFQLSDQVCWWLGGGLERHRRRRPTTEDFSKKYVSGYPNQHKHDPKKLGLSGVEGFTIKQSQALQVLSPYSSDSLTSTYVSSRRHVFPSATLVPSSQKKL